MNVAAWLAVVTIFWQFGVLFAFYMLNKRITLLAQGMVLTDDMVCKLAENSHMFVKKEDLTDFFDEKPTMYQ